MICLNNYNNLNAIRIKMGYKIDDWSEKVRYCRVRGYRTGIVLRDILVGWSKMNKFSYSENKQRINIIREY